jgi:nucleoside-diphosphate-sugar epimerase
MKILITGAAGFQAKYVIERLQPKHELTLFNPPAAARSDPLRKSNFLL